jgi:molybdenum cofactor synthesis domain-containing protein
MTHHENTDESSSDSDDHPVSESILLAKVLTVSDGVMSGSREDKSGEALVSSLSAGGFNVVEHRSVADGVENVATCLSEMTEDFAGVIITTGGTGFTERDLTPEGTLQVLERQAPGIAEAMRLVNPLGRLSRGVAGIVGKSIILNTPGSTVGCVECFNAVADVIPHALRLLHGERLH